VSQSSWRTTPQLVAEIIETDPNIVGPTLAGLAPFIDAANNIVTKVCVPQPTTVETIQPSPYDAVTLELIERWLAAHFYAVRDFSNQVVAESAGDTSQTFMNFGPGRGLYMTRWGSQAMFLDYQGYLAAQQKRQELGTAPRPGIHALGRRRRGPSGFGGF